MSLIPAKNTSTANNLVRILLSIPEARYADNPADIVPNKIAGIICFHLTSLFFVWIINDNSAIGIKNIRFMPCASN